MGNISDYLVKVDDYYTRNGQRVPINLNSPSLSSAVEDVMGYIKTNTGLSPNSKELNDRDNRNLLYDALIKWVPEVESEELKNHYGTTRNKILGNGGDLGQIIEKRAAVCRELSCFSHIVTAMYGINTRVCNGNLRNGGGHAWVKTGGKSTILDFNKFRNVFDARDYPGDPISEQVLVKYKKF